MVGPSWQKWQTLTFSWKQNVLPWQQTINQLSRTFLVDFGLEEATIRMVFKSLWQCVMLVLLLLCRLEEESCAFFSSGRLWDDGVILPQDTRKVNIIHSSLTTILTVEGANAVNLYLVQYCVTLGNLRSPIPRSNQSKHTGPGIGHLTFFKFSFTSFFKALHW